MLPALNAEYMSKELEQIRLQKNGIDENKGIWMTVLKYIGRMLIHFGEFAPLCIIPFFIGFLIGNGSHKHDFHKCPGCARLVLTTPKEDVGAWIESDIKDYAEKTYGYTKNCAR